LIAGLDNGRWLAVHAAGIDCDLVLAIARSCVSVRPTAAAKLFPGQTAMPG